MTKKLNAASKLIHKLLREGWNGQDSFSARLISGRAKVYVIGWLFCYGLGLPRIEGFAT